MVQITGSSQGLGLALTRHVLGQGHRVIASSRNPSKTPDLVAEIEGQGGKWLKMDVTAADIEEKMVAAEAAFGHIDVLVNMAGYAVLGAIEDTPMSDVVKQMNANFYGPLKLMRCALPGMRKRRAGMIVNISSAQGLCPSPANGVYAASKAALEAATESLGEEVKPFGIRVLIVEPGAYRTGFGSVGATVIPPSQEYAGEEHPVGKRMAWVAKLASLAMGSPEKAARVMFEAVVAQKQEFLRLIIGPDCWKRADEKVSELRRTVDAQKELAASTNL